MIRTENYETDTEEQILVKDVMTSPLITVKENTCIPMVAQLMEHYKIGSAVVTSKQGKTETMTKRIDYVEGRDCVM